MRVLSVVVDTVLVHPCHCGLKFDECATKKGKNPKKKQQNRFVVTTYNIL